MNNKPVSYLQTDPKWSKLPYRTSQEKATIGGSGCGPTAMAMVIATWVDPTVTPITTCDWSVKHGYKATGNGTYHSYFVPQAKAYGLVCERINTTACKYMTAANAKAIAEKARAYVDEGHMVIALMGKGNWTTGGHYILWYSNDGDDVLINDPASTKANRIRNTFDLLRSQAGFYWVIKVPEEVISMTNSEVKTLIAEEVAKAVGNVKNEELESKNKELEAKVESLNKELAELKHYTFPCTDTPSDWAAESWEKAKASGITDGTNPRNAATREQMMAVIDRLGFLDKEEENTATSTGKKALPPLNKNTDGKVAFK